MDQKQVAHTRLHLANERTLLSWIKLGCIFTAGGFLTRVAIPKDIDLHSPDAPWEAKAQQFSQLCLGMIVICVGLSLFVRRRKMFADKWMGSYGFPRSLRVAVGGIFVTLFVTLLQALSKEAEYNSADCLRLKTEANVESAPPPYLYVSFHGTNTPLADLCTGVGAVQRFSLSGAYAGPATDQRAALVHSPRGLILHNELLILADAGEGASLHKPSLAIFGDCAGRDKRPFLGRVRAPDPQTELAFTHPYGLAAGKNGVIQASAQNGGALLAVALSNRTAPISVVEQLEPPVSADHIHSGPLRGLAIDDDGCSHIADKHAGRVAHVCPGSPTRFTSVDKPVGVFADGRLLYVGSFVDVEKEAAKEGKATKGEAKEEAKEGTGGDSEARSAVHVFKRSAAPDSPYTLVRSITHKKLVHPAGLLTHDGVLYVLEQTHRALLSFDPATGNFNGVLVEHLPDAPEGLVLAPGC